MTPTDELKILDDKIKANEARYDLDRGAAKISALSSKELDKYEDLIGEDLGCKPGVVEQTKFEYSLLGKVFNMGLEKEDKKEGLLIRWKNIEDKKEKQLKMIENKNSKKLGTKSVTNIFDEELKNQRICSANVMLKKKVLTTTDLALKEMKIWKMILWDYKSLKELFKDIYYKKFSIKEAESIQEEFNAVLTALEKYKPRDSGYKSKN